MEGDGIQVERRDEIASLNSSADEVSHLALDIGGTLIKMVYFSSNSDWPIDDEGKRSSNEKGSKNCNFVNGRLHFMKFETRKINDCLQFISSKQLHRYGGWHTEAPVDCKNVIKATGGGAFKFADLFKEKLEIGLDKVEEMDSLVAGANFLLKAVDCEAFTYMDGEKEYVQIDHNDLYPYLLVNIGSGVSMIKGNNRVIDMLVGDIYGGMDYSKIGLLSTTIASSFGKAISENKEIEDYRPEDVARSLLRMISNNIGQISYLNALRFGLKRIFFGGFFIRGHAYTMDTIAVAVNFWSKGEAKAMFLRHEGFLGAMGAFMSYPNNGLDHLMSKQLVEQLPKRACCPKHEARSPLLGDLTENGSIECSVQLCL
ncbi:hypothetical protein RJ639_000319 [Escallonia herrerae]|uniref:Pantothenate kinase 1 n=1 Tax=Escallonia herrerae TaxID=1293975 RepID=A0AA89BI01_9ASTE|nr:hypothetical protein RJ639_000319 [Escallonia herrerae]